MTFLLHTHTNFTNHGPIIQLESSPAPITPEYVFKKYGPGYFCVKQNSPHIHRIWKGWLGTPGQRAELEKRQSGNIIDLKPLERKTDYIGYGLIGSFGTQALGFGLSHLRFSQIEDRIARVETALRSLPVQGLACTLCSTPILTMLQESCTGCDSPIEWPKNSPTKNSTSRKWSLP